MENDTKSIICLTLFALTMLIIGYQWGVNFTTENWNTFAVITLVCGLSGGAVCMHYLGQNFWKLRAIEDVM